VSEATIASKFSLIVTAYEPARKGYGRADMVKIAAAELLSKQE